MQFFHKKRLPGFSLLELIVAASIIAILATVTVINTRENRARARDANRRTTVGAYSTSMEQWKVTSADKSYFVSINGGVPCVAGNIANVGNPPVLPSQNYGYMSGSPASSCVGINGGGGGRMTRKNLTANGASYGQNSIVDALKLAGFVNAVRVDPAAENLALSDNLPDFVLTTCDSNGYAAENSKDATEFAIYARLERAGIVTNNPDVVNPTSLCGGNAITGWNTIADWGGT